MDAMRENESPLVSVVVPVYGVEQYLDRCVESIVQQTYKRLQIILVDDGSPDACPRMCDEWAARDSRIQVIHKENGGNSSARNAGLAAALGQYVCIFDSDDYIDTVMIACMVKHALEYNAQMVICGNENEKYVNGEYSHVGTNTLSFGTTSNNVQVKELMPSLVRMHYCIPPWNKLYERLFLEKNDARFDEGIQVGEDSVFHAHLYERLERLVCIPDAFYHYVSREKSMCSQFNPNWFRQRRNSFVKVHAVFSSWSAETDALFASEFMYQTGVVLSSLYEDTSERTRHMRKSIIRSIAGDSMLNDALRMVHAYTMRERITKLVLSSRNEWLMSVYGNCIAMLKRRNHA